MNFIDAMQKQLKTKKTVTENGAIGYATSGKYLLDMNFAVSSMRNWSEEDIKKAYTKAYYENPLYAIKWLFFARDIRGNGMGERRLFRICFKWLLENQPEEAFKVLGIIPEYGRWDDIICQITDNNQSDINNHILTVLGAQLTSDVAAERPSLLAKWMPSINASSQETKRLGRTLANGFNLTERQYRKILSCVRKKLNLVESNLSQKTYENIDYSFVPSVANLKYKDAFMRNDEERRRAYLASLERGETKINASTNFPSDIVASYHHCRTTDTTLEEMWKALPDYVNGDGNTLVIRDGSYSMTTWVTATCEALDIATALAIYFAEHSTGAFHNKFITFSSTPKIVDLNKCKTLRDKLNICNAHDDCSNTNIEKTFDLILDTAIKNDMPQEDMPKNILIVSDMEFDCCAYNSDYDIDKALFDELANRFENHGYKLPRLIFWNVCSRSIAVPLQQNDMGVALVSGFSPAIYNMVLSGELDPYKCLLEAINSDRYDLVEEMLK